MPGTRKTQKETKDSQEKHREETWKKTEDRIKNERSKRVRSYGEIKQPETFRDKGKSAI